MKIRFLRVSSLTVVGAALGGAMAVMSHAFADSVSIQASQDNTIFSENNDGSNGINKHIFSGTTSFNGIRRALLEFNLAGIPPGSTITSAKLKLYLSKTPPGFSGATAHIHRLLADWGEEASDSGEPGGTSAPAEPGDATWANTFWPDDFWTMPGGDFLSTPSATITVTGIGFYTWGSTSDMVSDVQSWLMNPGGNHGWILIGGEDVAQSAVRYESRENLTTARRPVLQVDYVPLVPTVGSVPDGSNVPGPELTVQRQLGGTLLLQWAASCFPSDTDYEVYEGAVGSFASHTPLLCTTGGATQASVTPGAGARYYLVVPRNGTMEGSYGKSSAGNQRPQGPSSCLPQGVAGCP